MPEEQQAKGMNGKAPWLVGGTSTIGLAVTLFWSQMQALENKLEVAKREGATALEVVKQHGEEFNDRRRVESELRAQIANISAQMNLGGRFTRKDGEDLRKEIVEMRRLMFELEREIARIEVEAKNK